MTKRMLVVLGLAVATALPALAATDAESLYL
jgi:hypothetical protein